jgi:hypothetical protein
MADTWQQLSAYFAGSWIIVVSTQARETNYVPRSPQRTPIVNSAATRNAGILLVAASVLEVAAMAHHPSVASSNIAQAVEQVARLSDLSGLIHGLLIGLMLAVLYAFTEFCRRRGVAVPMVRAGLIAYTIGVLAMIGAAMMSGFVITQVASLAPRVTEADLHTSGQLLILCSVLNQKFAGLGVVLMSVGIVLWSLDLLRSPRLARLLGIFGLLIGLLPAGALALGALHLNVHGMTQVVLLQSVWNIGVGLLLIRGSKAAAELRSSTNLEHHSS